MRRKQKIKQIKDEFLLSKGITPQSFNRIYTYQFNDHPEWFNELASLIFNNYYDYSECRYIDEFTKVTVIDPNHGEFQILPFVHLEGVRYFESTQYKNEHDENLQKEIIERFKSIHEDLYDYSKFEYLGSAIKGIVICNRCGQKFLTSYTKHYLQKEGCFTCTNLENAFKRRGVENFLQKAKLIHGDKYDYSIAKETYQGAKVKVEIICNDCGMHFFQSPDNHTNNKQGCPNCCRMHFKGEDTIKRVFNLNNTEYNFHQQFEGCRYKKPLEFDFYIPKLNLCIEYQGRQHREISDYYGGEKEFQEGQIRDQIKRDFCKKENIRLLEIWYDENIEEKLQPIIEEYRNVQTQQP